MKLEVGQQLIRQTAVTGDTCTVIAISSAGRGLALVELSNGERVDPNGWYFDPANPSAWRVVAKPEPAEARSIDAILDDIEVHAGSRDRAEEAGLTTVVIETQEHLAALRAELKALVSCEECGQIKDCCRECGHAPYPWGHE